jgi:hypothetical protein
MNGRNSPHTPVSRRGSGDLARVAEAVREAAPLTPPEVVRSEGQAEGVRMRVAPDQYLLLQIVDGQWMCRDVYVDADTGEPDKSPSAQRLMRESYRPLPVSEPRDLSEVADRFLGRAIAGWRVTAKHKFASEHQRQFAAEALSQLSSHVREPKPSRPSAWRRQP